MAELAANPLLDASSCSPLVPISPRSPGSQASGRTTGRRALDHSPSPPGGLRARAPARPQSSPPFSVLPSPAHELPNRTARLPGRRSTTRVVLIRHTALAAPLIPLHVAPSTRRDPRSSSNCGCRDRRAANPNTETARRTARRTGLLAIRHFLDQVYIEDQQIAARPGSGRAPFDQRLWTRYLENTYGLWDPAQFR